MSPLTERRKADREKMAIMVEALCTELGATFERTRSFGERDLRMEITAGKGRVGIDFDGASSQPDVYCMPWNVVFGSDARMTSAFGTAVGASVNPHHRRKCMGFAMGIDELLHTLRDAIVCINDGKAFEDLV